MLDLDIGRVLGEVREAFRVVLSANLMLVLAAFAIYYSSVIVYAVRWKVVLRSMGYDAPLHVLAAGFLGAVFINNITPTSRAGGELVRAAYLSYKAEVPAVPAFNSIVYERIVESLPVIALAIIAVLYGLYVGTWNPWLTGSVAALILLVIVFFRFWDTIIEFAIKKLGLNFSLNSNTRISKLFADKRLFLTALTLSSIVWILDVIRLYVVAMALGWEAPIMRFTIVAVIYLVLGIFGFTPGGLGIVEGGLSATLAAMGAPLKTAIGITVVERLISYASSTAVGFVIITLTGGREAWKRLRSR